MLFCCLGTALPGKRLSASSGGLPHTLYSLGVLHQLRKLPAQFYQVAMRQQQACFLMNYGIPKSR